MQAKQILTRLNNNPLLAAPIMPSVAKIAVPKKLASQPMSICLGIGLVTAKEVSVALPFDILGLLFAAERVRRLLELSKIHLVLADTHAMTNKLIDEKIIIATAQKFEQTLRKNLNNLNLTNFVIHKGSELERHPDFEEIANGLRSIKNQYLRLEVADCIWLQKHHNVGIKLGWSMGRESIGGHDEKFFDQTIKEWCPGLEFIHIKPGHTFDPWRPRVSPYISVAGERRILLQESEKVQEKIERAKQEWPDKTLGGALKHLANIVRLHDQLLEPLPLVPLTQKVQIILDKALL